MSATPSTQRAWRVVRKGYPSKALRLENLPVPTQLSSGEVLVKIQAASLNPVGYKLMGLLPNFLAKRPHVAEFDLAGVIIDGNGTKWKAGDAVYGNIPFSQVKKTRQGALAEYARLPAVNLLPRPPHVTPTQAAGLPTAGFTAYQCLFQHGALKKGQSIFVNGGSTSVGAFAIQLAKAAGCTVTASASAKNEQYVRGLGADEFFDYTKAPLHEQLVNAPPAQKYQVFVEAAGLVDPALYTHSEAYLAPDGVFVSMGPQPKGFDIVGIAKLAWGVFMKPTWLGGTKRKFMIMSVELNEAEMQAFNKLVEEEKVKTPVDSVYAFQDTLKAYERIMTGRATGKIIVKVDPDAE
ncbi:NAD(P)-binding protein [Obba rivulosa]|uniref:NAD(P)-binding protein n=1 Tax=Obba rivulosa TaxID=1052685 RepID=A0A8E2AW08_9APHY|nr:NAD(P)-binding protein [Obba rivulosa]